MAPFCVAGVFVADFCVTRYRMHQAHPRSKDTPPVIINNPVDTDEQRTDVH
ncbi:hypothetical protein RSSM_00908 [Rhodopirellula sallentina SM41]|uniref:Uncharacterized protein n=1 Tax=Rhodopirellula sallentina SM41 TaxID=1263870 RepID=M5U8P8_9BACT|nr:hypothetical protein RSSM_00908 [Rhodopirellula sallentina SM41]